MYDLAFADNLHVILCVQDIQYFVNTFIVDERGIVTFVCDVGIIDMNGDGNVTAVDARIILQKVAGLK